MRILLLTERFGDQIPTGVISQMIAEELRGLGNDIAIVSSEHIGERWTYGPHVVCRVRKIIPRRVLYWFSNLLQLNIITYRWRRMALKASQSLISSFKPDIIYARSTPIMVCEVAAVLHQQFRIPVMMHFTDPVPAPMEWDPNVGYRRRMIRTMNRVLPQAESISFGNAAMLEYQQSLQKYSFIDKSFVLPDPVPIGELYNGNKENDDKYRIIYLGSVYGNRNPRPLFDAISTLNQNGFNCEVQIFDINRTNLSVPPFVRFMGRTGDVKQALIAGDLLLNIDGDDKTPVFISSKLKEYLCCCRPILSITPKGSPSDILTEGLNTVFSIRNSSNRIIETIVEIMHIQWKTNSFNERIPLIESFSPRSVTEKAFSKMKEIIA